MDAQQDDNVEWNKHTSLNIIFLLLFEKHKRKEQNKR